MNQRIFRGLSIFGCASVSCSPGAEGGGNASVVVLLESEDVIVQGLAAGDRPEDIHDGWSVEFDRYIASVGHIELRASDGASGTATGDSVFAVDLRKLSPGGEPLWKLNGLNEGRYDFGYSTLIEGAERRDKVSEDEFSKMSQEDWSYLIAGRLSKPDGMSCPPTSLASIPDSLVSESTNAGGDPCYPATSVTFDWGFPGEAAYGPCEIDGIPGLVTTSGATTTVAITIHGDHLFFNGFPEGGEGGVMRLAQWVADCDLDLDGEVTLAELEQIAPDDLPEIDERFQLGGSPLTPLDNMLTYLQAQVLTQGHFQGEGECARDGEVHAH